MVAMAVLFALGWFVTEVFGIDVANQFTVFGARRDVSFRDSLGANADGR